MEIQKPKEIKGEVVSTVRDGDDLSWVHEWAGMSNDQRAEFIREAEQKNVLVAQKDEARWIEQALRDKGFIPSGAQNDLKQFPIDALTFPPKAYPRLSHEVMQYPARTDEDRELEEIGLYPHPRTVEEALDDLPQEVVIPQEKRGSVKRIQAGDVIPEAPAPKDRIVREAVVHTRALPPTGLFQEKTEAKQEAVESSDDIADVDLRERTPEEVRSDRIHSRIHDIGRTTRSEIVTTATMPYDDQIAKIMANNGGKKPVEMPREFMMGHVQVFWHAGAQYPEGHPLHANAQRVLYITHPKYPEGLMIAQAYMRDQWKSIGTQTAGYFLSKQGLSDNLNDNGTDKVPAVLKAFETMGLKQHMRPDEWPYRFVRKKDNHLEEFSIGYNKVGNPVVNYEVTYLDAGNKDRTTRMKMHSFQLEDFPNMLTRNDKLEKLEKLVKALPMKKLRAEEWVGAIDKLLNPREVLSRRLPSYMDRQFRIVARKSMKTAVKLTKQAIEAGANLVENTANAAREQFDKVRDRMPDLHGEFDLQPARIVARIMSALKL